MKQTLILAGLLAATSSTAIWISSLASPPTTSPVGPLANTSGALGQQVPACSPGLPQTAHPKSIERQSLQWRVSLEGKSSYPAQANPDTQLATNTERTRRPERHGMIAQAMGWSPLGHEAETIKLWLQERQVIEQGLLSEERTRGNIAAFNTASLHAAERLKQTFGSQAEPLALRLQLRRLNPKTAVLESVTLDGFPIPAQEDD